jgi:hypothetical protein
MTAFIFPGRPRLIGSTAGSSRFQLCRDIAVPRPLERRQTWSVLLCMEPLRSDHLLVKCVHCEAWPMAFVAREGSRLSFRCPKCRAQEVYRMGVAGTLIPTSGAV